jgi:hypothetical protein
MKKLVLTAAILMGFVMGSYAQHSLFENGKQEKGGLFSRGETESDYAKYTGQAPFLPNHWVDINQDADQEPEAPLGGGALLLIGFGAAYAMSKRNKKD